MDGRTDARAALRLRSILEDAEIVGGEDVRLTHCTTEAGLCRSGDVFVALVDEIDGHDHAAEAVRLGAAAVVASRPIAVNVPVCYVPDTRVAYGRICQAMAGNPSRTLKTIGVAGSFGKTTTGYLIASVLNAAGHTPGVLGSLGYCDGVEVADARWTTPPPQVTAAWLSRMLGNGCSHAVVETSPRGLALGHTAGIHFDACCLTNLHRDGRRSADARRTAHQLLEQLSPEGILVANVDDPGSADVAAEHNGPVLTVGINSPAEITATLIERHASEQTFLVTFGREVVPVRSRLVGAHNLGNCLVAAAVGTVYGIAPEVIVRGIESVAELPGRLERIECGQPFSVFLDEARSPAALSACLETLRATTRRRLLCVYHHSSLVADDADEWSRLIHSWCDEAIITDCRGATFAERPGVRTIHDRSDAIHHALRHAAGGDCVLIAGRAEQADDIADHEPIDWDDRQLVRRALYQLQQQETRWLHSA